MGLSSVSASKARFFLRRYGRRIMRSKKLQRYRILVALLLVVILWRRGSASLGSWNGSSRKLPGGEGIEVAVSQAGLDKPSSEVARQMLESSGDGENCSLVLLSGACEGKNVTACVENGTNGTFLVIWNGEETPLKVNVSFSPADNVTIDEIQAAKQKKVNITAYVGGSSSIMLDGGEGVCVVHTVFPSPSPPSITSGSDKGISHVPDNPPASNASSVADVRKCLAPSKSCLAKNLTACLHYNRNATMETLLLVQNGGEIPLTVNITLLPANISLVPVDLPYRHWETVNVTEEVGASTSIQLSAGEWNCVVDVVSESNSPKQFSSSACAALFAPGVVILAAALVYWKLQGAPATGRGYEQLQMGTVRTNSTTGRTVETAGEGWDQSWGDEDWDEEKAVKSPGSVQKGNLHVNSIKAD